MKLFTLLYLSLEPASMKAFLLSLFLACALVSVAQTDTLRICSFNIRYDNADDYPNDWPHRRDTLASFLKAQHLDLIDMQEVLHNQLEDLRRRLPLYEYVGVGRDDGKEKGEYSPVFYRKDRFRLLGSGTFWLSQHPDSAGFIGWDGACTRLATWLVLQDRAKGGKEFFLLNTHFDHVGQEARRQSARLIRRRIEALAQGRKVIVTGDLNVSDQSEAYRLLTEDGLLRDAWKAAERREGVNYSFHDFGQLPVPSRAKIDFVFVSDGFRVTDYAIPAEDGAKGFLSDHNPQVVELLY